MVTVVGIRLKRAGKIYSYKPGALEVKVGDKVIVETPRGMECGTVVLGPREVDETKLEEPPKAVHRLANASDLQRVEENKQKAKDAFVIGKKKIAEHGLEMKLVGVEYTFDMSKIIFYFTADGRVDFRELVKDLASVFRTRIELRQIGVRDEAKLMGGIGCCGRPLCCATFLGDFEPVSIRMAKEQNLSLNPTKISGLCGRLMCCLKNEEETYEYLNKSMPRRGDAAVTPDGEEGTVYNVNILRQRVAVMFETNDTREVREYDADELDFAPKGTRQLVPKPKKESSEESAPVVRDNYQAAVKAAIERNTEEKAEREEREKQRKERGYKKGYRHDNNRNGGRRNGKKYEGNHQKKSDNYRRKNSASSDEQWDEYNGKNNNRRYNQNRRRNNDNRNYKKNDRNDSHDKKVTNGGYSSFQRENRENKNSGDTTE